MGAGLRRTGQFFSVPLNFQQSAKSLGCFVRKAYASQIDFYFDFFILRLFQEAWSECKIAKRNMVLKPKSRYLSMTVFNPNAIPRASIMHQR